MQQYNIVNIRPLEPERASKPVGIVWLIVVILSVVQGCSDRVGPSIDELVADLQSNQIATRLDAFDLVAALSELPREAITPLEVMALEDEDFFLRGEAMLLLARKNRLSRSLIEAISNQVFQKQEYLREVSLLILDKLEDRTIPVSIYQEALRTAPIEKKEVAARMLARLDPDGAESRTLMEVTFESVYDKQLRKTLEAALAPQTRQNED